MHFFVWSLCAYFGGRAIDKSWFQRPSRRVAVGLLIPIVSLMAVMMLFRFLTFHDGVNYLTEYLGWGLGIILHPKSDQVFGYFRKSAEEKLVA